MDLKSPGTRGTYVDLVKTDLKYVGKKEMSTYFLRNIELLQKEVDEEDLFNEGLYVQCVITLGRRLLSIMVRNFNLYYDNFNCFLLFLKQLL